MSKEKIINSAQQLVAASRNQIFKWMREGLTQSEIIEKLKSFRLPAAESAKLKRELRDAMDELRSAQKILGSDLSAQKIQSLSAQKMIALSNVSLPNMQRDLSDAMAREIHRSIASGAGITALRRRLENLDLPERSSPETIANTVIASYNNNITFERSKQTGTKYFEYSGPVSSGTRPFCRAHAGQIFSREEILKMNNGQGLPVMSSCGGYNCRHEWIAVPDEQPDGMKEEIKFQRGKQSVTMLMSKERQKEYFKVQRSDWIDYARPDNYLVAKPIARAHDGLNPEGDDAYSEGLWKNIFRSKGRSNYESHLDKRLKDGSVKNGSEYRQKLNAILNNNNADVYAATTGDGSVRYIIKDGDWIVMIDRDGLLHTSFKLEREFDLLASSKKIGTLKNFIGL